MKNLKHSKTNFRRLLPYIKGMEPGGETHRRFQSGGMMPLVIEYLYYTDCKGRPVYSMAHYGEQNGDAMRDPDLTFSVDWETGSIEPQTYQNDYLGVYQEVYMERDGKTLYHVRLRSELDQFLYDWLGNIEIQEYEKEVA